MKKTEEKIILFIKEHELLNRGDKILVALSGGADSVLLLYFLLKFRKKYGISIGAMHVNHMIRGKSADEDEKFCRSLCEKFQIDYHSVKYNVPKYAELKKISVEEAAREIRYRELTKAKQKFKYDKIATAHTCSDNAETILLNVIKGAGLKGISGIPIKRDFIIRPILPLTKNEIVEYLSKAKLDFITDLSNLDDIYERNFIRNNLIPLIKKLNPKVEQTLFKSSLLWRQQALILESIVKIISDFVINKRKNFFELDIELLNKLDEKIRNDIVKSSVERNLSTKLTFNECKRIISLLSSLPGKKIELSNKLVVVRERSKIVFSPQKKQSKLNSIEVKIGGTVQIEGQEISIDFVNKSSVKFHNNKNVEFISADNISSSFIIRRWQFGDRFYPIGLNGSKKVSDFLSDLKLSSLEKQNQLVLTNNKKIVWVVGCRLDERFKVSTHSRKILKLCTKKIKTR